MSDQFRVIRPNAITSATQLVATNVAEADAGAHSMTTAYTSAARVMSAATHRIYEAVKVQSVQSVTATVANPGVINWPAHGFVDGTPISFAVSAGGAMWTGITAGVEYYVKNGATNPDAFSVSATVGGAAINITGAGSGTVTATAKSNYGRDPTLAVNRAGSTPFWRDAGATNRYKMFDQSSSSQTENANSITATIKAGRASALALINIDATSVNVKVRSGGEVKYDKNVDLTVKNVKGLWSYFYEPIIRKTDAVLMDLPPYADGEIDVTINKPGGIARAGGVIVGMPRDLGEMQTDPEIRILDYSTKTKNTYGDTELKAGKNAKLISCEIFVEPELIDETRRLLSTYTGTALVYVGDERFSSTILFGFFQDFRAVIPARGGVFANLSIEGLT